VLDQDRHVDHASTGIPSILCLGAIAFKAPKSAMSDGAVGIKCWVLDGTPVATYLRKEVSRSDGFGFRLYFLKVTSASFGATRSVIRSGFSSHCNV